MSGLRAVITDQAPIAVAVGGLLIGLAFGALIYRTNFCTMGSISDMVLLGDRRRFRAWLLAAATAIAGTQILELAGIVELPRSMYLAPRVNWLGSVAGGLMFGIGMVLAGGCASRNLVRAGGGDLRALVALVILGISAHVSMGGLLGPARAWLEQTTAVALTNVATPSLGNLSVSLAEGSLFSGNAATAAMLVGVIALFCFVDGRFRRSPVHVFSGIGVGLCVVAGWALTGLAYDEMSVQPYPPASLTFVRPTGDAIDWMQRFTALGLPGFGVATVIGTVVGALGTAMLMGRFRLSGFSDPKDTMRTLAGAALMGVGGVLALGCTIGQAVTGVSTLALGSFLAFAAIVAGGVIGVKVLERLVAET